MYHRKEVNIQPYSHKMKESPLLIVSLQQFKPTLHYNINKMVQLNKFCCTINDKKEYNLKTV